MPNLRIVIAQLNFCVGDLINNRKQHLEAAQHATEILHADLIVFPELSLTGYPPEDLLLRQDFLLATKHSLTELTKQLPNIYCLVGHPHLTPQGLTNTASLIYHGKIVASYAKQYLPNYDVFDEHRYFVPGNQASVTIINDIPLGIVICEDLWHPEPVAQAAKLGARVIVAPNASPFSIDKHQQRVKILHERASTNNVAIFYVNQIGAQDGLSFDGGSMALDPHGIIKHLAGFKTSSLHPVDVTLNQQDLQLSQLPYTLPDPIELIYQQLVVGVRDYIIKNKLPGAIIGVSGGIDSALTLAIAVDAVGASMVQAVFLPSPYTSTISQVDAAELAHKLGVELSTIAITPTYNTLRNSLGYYHDSPIDLILENLQSRCRGIILMALSNQSGKIVLITANHSELAVGYGTMYGDLAGGFAVLKDVPKTLVYELAKYRNKISPIIPQRTIEREPSAELAPGQLDSDSLPPYHILDKILELYLNQELSATQIISAGFAEHEVTQVLQLIKHNEYKRHQLAPGIRLRAKSFGKDRRYPITSGFTS